MRVNGHTLRPSNLAERRLLAALGVESLRVPREMNPFAAARRIRRAASCTCPDHLFARDLAARTRGKIDAPSEPSPGLDMPEPVSPLPVHVHALAA